MLRRPWLRVVIGATRRVSDLSLGCPIGRFRPGVELSEQQLNVVTLGFHYGLAISRAPVYQVLRRKTQLRPVGAGLATGAATSLVADEIPGGSSAAPRTG